MLIESPTGLETHPPPKGKGGRDAAGRGMRRPVVSKQDVCERKASPVAPVKPVP